MDNERVVAVCQRVYGDQTPEHLAEVRDWLVENGHRNLGVAELANLYWEDLVNWAAVAEEEKGGAEGVG